MRIKLMGSLVAAACLVGMPMAAAQNDSEADQGANTTCTDFMAMDSADQAALVEEILSATPDLKTNGAEGSSASANASGSMSAGSSDSSSAGSSSSAGDAAKDSGVSAEMKGATNNTDLDEAIAGCKEDSTRTVGDALTR